MPFTLSHEVRAAICAHAIACYPLESCGVIKDGAYVRCTNVSRSGGDSFRIAPEEWLALQPVEALVHSHPDGFDHPSQTDMAQQLATDIAWGIVSVTRYDRNGPPVAGMPWFWGGAVEIPHIMQRPFRHGPSGSDRRGDCYALIRDLFRVGAPAVAGLGGEAWPHQPIELPEFPRDNNWWNNGSSLYLDGYRQAGFERVLQVAAADLLPGDVLLAQVASRVPNHGAVYLGNGLIAHHKPNRLSCTEPVGRWMGHVTHMLRHVGAAP